MEQGQICYMAMQLRIASQEGEITRLRAELAAKTQECEELRRDAERWRRQRLLGLPRQDEYGFWIIDAGPGADCQIDATIKENKHE